MQHGIGGGSKELTSPAAAAAAIVHGPGHATTCSRNRVLQVPGSPANSCCNRHLKKQSCDEFDRAALQFELVRDTATGCSGEL
jgi:hypothetical protein